MKIPSFFKFAKNNHSEKPEIHSFSDFFLFASDKEKEAVLTKAAHQANEEQMRIFTAAQQTAHTK